MTETQQLQAISLADIHSHPLQPRVALGEETIASVREAITVEGGHYPVSMAVTVRPRPAGGFEILAGHHRVEAARQAGIAAVWAFVRVMDDKESAIFLAASNSHTEMTPFEHGRHAVYLSEQFDVSFADYARRMGRSTGWIYQCVSAFRVLEEHGGLDHPYADLPYSAVAHVGRIPGQRKQEEALFELMGHGNPASVASKLCTAVGSGEPAADAMRRIDAERKAPKWSEEHDGAKNQRPELAARADYSGWLASWVEGMAFALEVREDELARRRPNLNDPRQKKAFDDAVEARVRREWPSVRDGRQGGPGMGEVKAC